MSYYLDRSSQYLYTVTLPVSSPPFSISFWVKVNDVTGLRCMMYLGDKDTTNEYYRLDWSSARPEYIINDGTELVFTYGSDLSSNSWHHIAIAEYDVNDRYFWINGSEVTHNTTTKNIIGVDSWSFGTNYDSKSNYLGGYLTNIAVWNTGITSIDDNMLYDGISPLKIKSEYLVGYTPLITDLNNMIRSPNKFTAIGSPSSATPCPRLYSNFSPIISSYYPEENIFRPFYFKYSNSLFWDFF